MSRERVARCAGGRFTPMIHGLARALGHDPIAALVYQQLYYWSCIEADRDGWLDMSEVRMASEACCTRHAAREALAKVVEEEVVERQKGSGNRPDRYRVRQDKLRELLPHDASPQPQIAVDPQPQTSSPERDSDESLSHARAKEVRSEGSKEVRKEGENDNNQARPDEAREENQSTPSPAAGVRVGESLSDNNNHPDDAPSPPVGEQADEASEDNSSGEEVDTAPAIAAIKLSWSDEERAALEPLTAETKQGLRSDR